jgi:hypothetical protein
MGDLMVETGINSKLARYGYAADRPAERISDANGLML